MGTIYENIISLCNEANIKGGKMCVDLGISKSFMTKLKDGTKKNINSDTAQKIADYFGVSIDRVLSDEQKEKPGQIPLAELSEEKQQLIKVVLEMTDERAAALHRALNE